MSPHEFVGGLRESIIEENLRLYHDLLENTDVSSATDKYWISVLKLYGQLNLEQQDVLLQIVRQVIVDTLSNVLAILDGKVPVQGKFLEMELHLSSKGPKVTGNLQDMFLEIEETSST
jgi:hypothetical protein